MVQKSEEIIIDLTLRQDVSEIQQSLVKAGYSREYTSKVFQNKDKTAIKEMMTVLANKKFKKIMQF